MGKLNLKAESILEKEFNIDFKGYAAVEVDQFLDDVLNDYQTYEEALLDNQRELNALRSEIASLKAKNIELQGQQRVNDTQNTNSFSSVDLLKRVSRLEREMFRNNE